MKKIVSFILTVTLTVSAILYFREQMVHVVDQTFGTNPLKPAAWIDVEAMDQNPELYDGCEVTSLAMLLAFAGHPVSKLDLADQITKDDTPEVDDAAGNIVSWGDPNTGFVGDMTGANKGYGVNHGPIFKLLNANFPNHALDLTGKPFDQVLLQVSSGKPVIAWTTVDFAPTSNWVSWQSKDGLVKATFDEHVVLIVGYNAAQILINDPLDGTAEKAVDRAQFIASWNQMGGQAVSIQ